MQKVRPFPEGLRRGQEVPSSVSVRNSHHGAAIPTRVMGASTCVGLGSSNGRGVPVEDAQYLGLLPYSIASEACCLGQYPGIGELSERSASAHRVHAQLLLQVGRVHHRLRDEVGEHTPCAGLFAQSSEALSC